MMGRTDTARVRLVQAISGDIGIILPTLVKIRSIHNNSEGSIAILNENIGSLYQLAHTLFQQSISRLYSDLNQEMSLFQESIHYFQAILQLLLILDYPKNQTSFVFQPRSLEAHL